VSKTKPPIIIGRRYRYRQRNGVNGVFAIAELVRKSNGWWVIGHDKKANRTVEVQPGAVFQMNTHVDRVAFGPINVWIT
jgi:hypothetical protein